MALDNPFSILKKYWLRIILSLIYILFLPILFNPLFTLFYCDREFSCKVWDAGFKFINYSLGSIFIGYIGAFISKQKLSVVLKLFFPIILVLYTVGIYITLTSYVKVTSNYIEFRDKMNHVPKTHLLWETINEFKIISNPLVEGGYGTSPTIFTKSGKIYKIGLDPESLEYAANIGNIPISFTCEGCKK
ncbi:MAG: hypothetical protein Q7S61_05195 [bacterium]|nr:hypothetical protein [bacterium]